MPRELVLRVTIKDCEVQHFRVGGHGGQHKDKSSTGARVIHPPSGARGESREERSQLQNKKTAFVRMAKSPEFTRWLRVQHARKTGEIERWLDEQMKPENLLIEAV